MQDLEEPPNQPKRPSPLQEELLAAGAHMGFSAGWEVPLWYARPGEKPHYAPSFERTNWQLEQEREYKIVTEAVAVADLTPFAKFELSGPESSAFLDRVVAGSVPKPGKTTLAHMLTTGGKVYAELTITCLEESKFWIITGGGSEGHDLRRLKEVARTENFDVTLTNVTEEYGVLGLAGPNSGALVERLTDQQDWPFLQARQVKIGEVECLAIRISYTGELGWEIYPKMSDMSAVYSSIMSAGAGLNLGHVGTRWGHEMNKDTSPIETGLMPFVRMKKKAEFIGKAGLAKLMQKPASSTIVFLRIDGKNIDPEGDESVTLLGKPVGHTTSGCYSPLLGSPLAMASVPPMFAVPGTELKVVLGGEERPALVLEGPPALTQPAREGAEKSSCSLKTPKCNGNRKKQNTIEKILQ